MKRISVPLLLLALLLCTTAFADVIWEPDDDYYWDHYKDCTHYGRGCLANGKEGYILLYNSPGSNRPVSAFANGNLFYVSFTYEKGGTTYGVVQYELDGYGGVIPAYSGGQTAWVNMADMLLVYDNQSFIEGHDAVFTTYTDELAGYDFGGLDIALYTYPGSGTLGSTLAPEWLEGDIPITSVYTDEDGLAWGYVPYLYGHRGWLCISDPTNMMLPARGIEYEEMIAPVDPPADVLERTGGGPSISLVIALVAGVAAITAILIYLFYH